MESIDSASCVAFSATPVYRSMHKVLMELIRQVDKDDYHGPKLRRSLERWAHNGRFVPSHILLPVRQDAYIN
jgi:hypothetical protein